MSLEIQEQVNASLKIEDSPEESVKSLQGSLQEIIEVGSYPLGKSPGGWPPGPNRER